MTTSASDTKSPRFLSPIEILLSVLLVLIWGYCGVAFVKLKQSRKANYDFTGIVPIQSLVEESKSPDITFAKQSAESFKFGKWHEADHVLFQPKKVGDWARFNLPETAPGKYQLQVYFTLSYDYGIIQIFVDNVPVGDPIDLWSDGVMSTGPRTVGVVELADASQNGAAKHVIEFRLIGKSEGSRPPFYQFGIDGIVLEAQR